MTRIVRNVVLVATAVCAGAVLTPTSASAHPLGNFSVNRYDGVVVGAERTTVQHVIDLAEVPTVQEQSQWDRDSDGTGNPAELAAYAATTCDAAANDLSLTIDGRVVALGMVRAGARTLPGQAGLSTLRVECMLQGDAVVARDGSDISFVDESATTDVGWREVVLSGDGVRVESADVPDESTSAALTEYPDDLLSSPLDVRSADAQVVPDASVVAERPDGEVGGVDRGGIGPLTRAFESTVSGSSGLVAGTVAIVLAMLVGATHALAPGHGKTVMALALTGRRGSTRDAAAVGAAVTVTHTVGVLVLGLVIAAGSTLAPGFVTRWLVVAGGLLVVVVGLVLLRDARRGGHTHGHGHGHGHGDGHGHGHDHQHGGGPGGHVRAHEPAAELVAVGGAHPHPHPHPHPHQHPHEDHDHRDEAPHRRRSLVTLGIAGGLVPSPSALLVLLAAVAIGRAWFGIVLVVAFGIGMASTLAGFGIVVLHARDRVANAIDTGVHPRLARVWSLLPVTVAIGVVALGAWTAYSGITAIAG